MPPYPKIYQRLILAAHQHDGHATYAELATLAGLDTSQPQDRAQLGEILGEISTYEYNNNRPLLSVVAWFSGKPEPSEGFYKLAHHLGLFPKKGEKIAFFISELNKVREYWSTIDLSLSNIEITVEDYKAALSRILHKPAFMSKLR